MGLFRLLFWIAIIAAAFWLWRRLTRPAAHRTEDRNTRAAPAPMVRCEHCGTHVPRDHALKKGEQWFCSQTHLEQGPQPGER
ncbi:PP0621 family protein [Pseudomonas sp.]|uniref:PP0621 family protein n=1 Tax=Pseudomonas sp. TaxID=306 RepID=UPI00405479A2